MADVDIKGHIQFVIDFEVVVRTEHIALETTAVVEAVDFVVRQ